MKRIGWHIGILFLLSVIFLTVDTSHLHNYSVDYRSKLFPRDATGNIVIVKIDSPSLNQVGIWPWPRILYAELIDQLISAGASEIAFDIDFHSVSDPISDSKFALALEKAGGSVILPVFKQFASDQSGEQKLFINKPLPSFAKHSWPATVNVILDPDGKARQYLYGELLEGEFVPSLGTLIAGKFEGSKSFFFIDFSIDLAAIPSVSFVDVLGGRVGKNFLKDKKVIVGGTAVELGDRFQVPLYGNISGPELQALAAETSLQNREIIQSGDFISYIGLLVILTIGIFISRKFNLRTQLIVFAGLVLLIEFVALVLQSKSAFQLNTSLWLVCIFICSVALLLNEIDFQKLLKQIAQQKFQQIAISLGDGVVCVNSDDSISFWNPSAESIFGYSAEEMIGQSISLICAQSSDQSTFSVKEFEIKASAGYTTELIGIRKNGELFPLEACITVLNEAEGSSFGILFRDISIRKREQERIRYLAEHDTLTQLYNRNYLHQELSNRLGYSEQAGQQFALLLIDLDNFKEVNDTLGHNIGDQLLCEFAEFLIDLKREGDIVARLGGDEFAVITECEDEVSWGIELADKICRLFWNENKIIDGHQFEVSSSIGISIYPTDGKTPQKLLANADLALYRAKATEGTPSILFQPEMRQTLVERRKLEAELREAVKRGEFRLFYQPQICLSSGRLIGVEALIRWEHPDRGIVSPDEFMEVVNAGTISDLVGRWVLENACKQGQNWNIQGHNVRMGVNLSPSQFKSINFLNIVQDVLDSSGLPPSFLDLEITENILLDEEKYAVEILTRLRKMGISIAFDDFGTGYASLTYLKLFPLDRIKIDRSFVKDLLINQDSTSIVLAIISMAKLMNISVIAEGIEDQLTLRFLKENSCDEGQGYFFGEPVDANEIDLMLHKQNVDGPLFPPDLSLEEFEKMSDVESFEVA